jgi:pilus assembly protein Flp/PilA
MIMLISNLVAYLRSDSEEGQTLVEYGLLLALIAIVVIAILVLLGPAIAGVFEQVNDELP